MSRLYYTRQFTLFTSSNQGYLWSLQVKLEPVVNLLVDKGKLMDFLLQRKECKMVILSVCSQSKFKCFLYESTILPIHKYSPKLA